MGAAVKIDEQEFDEVFGKIAKLYDHAENFLRIAYTEAAEDKDRFYSQIENMVAQIEISANTIAEEFSKVIESGNEPSTAMKIRVTSALRKVINTVEDYKKHATLSQN